MDERLTSFRFFIQEYVIRGVGILVMSLHLMNLVRFDLCRSEYDFELGRNKAFYTVETQQVENVLYF